MRIRTAGGWLLNTLAISFGNSPPLSASPLIIPDAVVVQVGQAQVFTVQNATVQRFNLSAANQLWSSCLAVDETFYEPNSIRLIAFGPCRGLVYITATIGTNRSPLAAVMQIQ